MKNCLIEKKTGSYELAPAYDILAVHLLMPEDDEELALTLNGKKKKINRLDFDTAMIKSGIPKRAMENLWVRIERRSREWSGLISNSFLQKENKERLEKLLKLKQNQLK